MWVPFLEFRHFWAAFVERQVETDPTEFPVFHFLARKMVFSKPRTPWGYGGNHGGPATSKNVLLLVLLYFQLTGVRGEGSCGGLELPCKFRISAKSNLTEISVISAERPFDRNFVPKGAGGWWWHSATGPRSTRCHPCPAALIERRPSSMHLPC